MPRVTDPPSCELLGRLLSVVAHDLRNPLSAVQSNVCYLATARRDVGADEREALADALASCDGLANLIDSLELLSQWLTEDAARAAETVRVAEVVTDVLARHRAAASSHGVELRSDPSAEDEGLQVHANREMFARALANLLRNCIQHSRSGGVVRVLARREGGRCVVVVADHGARMAAELAEVAFQAEGQLVAKGNAHGRYGRGLGLYCAHLSALLAGAAVAVGEPPPPASNAFELSAPWE